jgi:hypothetical protein
LNSRACCIDRDHLCRAQPAPHCFGRAKLGGCRRLVFPASHGAELEEQVHQVVSTPPAFPLCCVFTPFVRFIPQSPVWSGAPLAFQGFISGIVVPEAPSGVAALNRLLSTTLDVAFQIFPLPSEFLTGPRWLLQLPLTGVARHSQQHLGQPASASQNTNTELHRVRCCPVASGHWL